MEQSRTRWIWFTMAAFAADRATKYAVEKFTSLDYYHVIIPKFFSLVHAQNPGLAFGVLADSPSSRMTALLSISTLVVCLILTWLLVSGRAGGGTSRIGVALILGGALGNLFDRVLYSNVTDFLYFQISTYHWPAFNLADSAITVGAVLVGIELIFLQRHAASPEER
jgi:signal peptidase II